MAASVIQHPSSTVSTATTKSVTLSSTASGSTLLALLAWRSASATLNTIPGSFVQVGSTFQANGMSIAICKWENATAGTTTTGNFVISSSVAFGMCCLELGGLPSSNTAGTPSSNSGTSASASSASLATSRTNNIAVYLECNDNADTSTTFTNSYASQSNIGNGANFAVAVGTLVSAPNPTSTALNIATSTDNWITYILELGTVAASFDPSTNPGWQVPSADASIIRDWQFRDRRVWNAIRAQSYSDGGFAWVTDDPFKALPAQLCFQNPTVETPRNRVIFIARQAIIAEAPANVDGGPGFFTDDLFHRPDWQNLPVEHPRNQRTQASAQWLAAVAPSYFDPTGVIQQALTYDPSASTFTPGDSEMPDRASFHQFRPDDADIAAVVYNDAQEQAVGVIEAAAWRHAWQSPARRWPQPYSTEIHLGLPLAQQLVIKQMEFHLGAQIPVRPLPRQGRAAFDFWPASDPILVAPQLVPPFIGPQPVLIPSKVKRPLPPLSELPLIPFAESTGGGGGGGGAGDEVNHAYEFQVGQPSRSAYRRPVHQAGAVRTPTFLVEVIEDVYQVWNVQQTQTVRRLPPPRLQATVGDDLARTAPAQIPTMEPFDVSLRPVRRTLPVRTGETTSKLVPFLEDVGPMQSWSVPVAPLPRAMPYRPNAQPETIATLPEVLDSRILRYDVQPQPLPVRMRVPQPAVIAQPVLPADKGQDFVRAWDVPAQMPTPRARTIQQPQQVTLERTVPPQIPPMLPFDVAGVFVPRRPVPSRPVETVTKIIAELQDVPQFESWVQPVQAYPTRQSRLRPMTQPQEPPQTAFYLNIPFDAASFQVWHVQPQPLPKPRRPVAMLPAQASEGTTYPPWQGTRVVIVVAGPFATVVMQVSVAGAVGAQVVPQ